MSALNVHPAAAIFPMLEEAALVDLAADIAAHGLRQPIILLDGAVLDGRNRLAACQRANVEPHFVQFDGGDPYAFTWSLNGARRDLTADQRYLIWRECGELSDAWKSEQARLAREANAKRSEAQKGISKAEIIERAPTSSGQTFLAKPAEKTRIAETKAALSGTNRGTVERMDKLAKDRPDLAEKVKAGELPAANAVREMKRAAIVEQLEDVAAKQAKAASGIYDVIVIDPPWPMEKIERDERPNQSQFDYPVMSEVDLANLSIPTADGCHVWVWTTHKHMPMALRLLDAWALKYVCTFVWHKPGGFQPFGLPQYNCEFAIYARKGTPQFIDTKAFPVCFDAPRGAHSEKPEAFYETVRRVTAGRRLDMFNRRMIEGFDGWGNETPSEEAA